MSHWRIELWDKDPTGLILVIDGLPEEVALAVTSLATVKGRGYALQVIRPDGAVRFEKTADEEVRIGSAGGAEDG